MPRPNNYAIMAEQARKRFLTYDQTTIIAKSLVTANEHFLYLQVLDRTCRIHRQTGHIHWSSPQSWNGCADFHDTLTIFDYLCDAKPDRHLSGTLKSTASFGHMFHTGLVENSTASDLERLIDQNPAAFCRACAQMGGTPFPNCDIGFILPFFPDLPVTLQFWHSDEEFQPRLRCLWDSNSLQFLRYETMYYAQNMLHCRLKVLIDSELA